jgi:hypothetical protein
MTKRLFTRFYSRLPILGDGLEKLDEIVEYVVSCDITGEVILDVGTSFALLLHPDGQIFPGVSEASGSFDRLL